MTVDYNKLIASERKNKYGALGLETRNKIAEKLAEVKRLETQRGLGVRESVEAMKQADKLKAEARALIDWVDSAEFEVLAQQRNDAEDQKTLSFFSQMQSESIAKQAARDMEINEIFKGAANFLVGANPSDLKRQISYLLDGGENVLDDGQGNRYVRFTDASTGQINRCVMTAEGKVGFVMESRSNGQGE